MELPVKARGLRVLTIARGPLTLAVRQQSPLASARLLRAEDFRTRKLLLLSPESDASHHLILKKLKMLDWKFEGILSVKTLPDILGIVAAVPEFVAVIHPRTVAFDARGVAFRVLPEVLTLDTGFVFRRGNRSALMRNLIRVAEDVFREDRLALISK